MHIQLHAPPPSSTTRRVPCVQPPAHRERGLRSVNDDLPLLNKRVIVTAPRQYAGKLCGLLVKAGAQALSLPMIQIRRLSQPAAVQVRVSGRHLVSDRALML